MYVRLVKYVLEMNPDHEVQVFTSGKACIDHLHLNPAIITLDYSLPDMSGEDVLKRIRNYNKYIEVIILSGQKDISTAVKLLKDGAYDYITKDNETKERLLNTISHLKKKQSLAEEVEQLREELGHKYEFHKTIIGESEAIDKVLALLKKAVKTNITVSITGETGTGKEVVAKAIHYNSDRREGKFVAVNVAAIPKELLESELFGYEKGAFTGANTRKIGQFELANGGTLFLDEIGEMDINLQAKLLRALQEQEVMRIGGSAPIKFDARLIVATHRDLQEEVEKGNFREDLYYRMLGLPIKLPPLRDRDKDIIILAKFFLSSFCKSNKLNIKGFSPSATKKLLNYSFPGNVRELKAVVELAAVMAEGEKIEDADLQFNSLRRDTAILHQEMTLKEYTRRIVDYYLEKYDNNVLLVAEKLDIGKSTIYRMLKEDEPEAG